MITPSNPAAEQAIKNEVDPGERLLWAGIPRQGLLLRSSDALMIPFTLAWGGFAFFWEYSVWHLPNARPGALLFGSLFVAVGIYIILGRFFVDSRQRGKTFYGLTDQRIIIVSGFMSREIKTIALKNLGEMSLRERSNGSGSIFFGNVPPMYGMWYGTAWPGMSRKLAPAFDLIDDVRKIYTAIKEAQRAPSV